MTHSDLTPDEEVILLRGAWELIDEMVNFALLDLRGNDPDSEVRFHTHIHQRYFNVLLTDFLSRTDRKLPLQQTSFLGGLRAISSVPRFGKNSLMVFSAAWALSSKRLRPAGGRVLKGLSGLVLLLLSLLLIFRPQWLSFS